MHGLGRPVLGGLALTALATCAPPEAPALPPVERIGPQPPAAFACTLPYARFANGSFRWLDMDRGTLCTVFLEQDECILGVYRDCTVPETDPREWRGEIDSSTIALSALVPEGPTRLPRPPRCCRGVLDRPENEPAWSRLSCRLLDCENPNDRSHVGVYLEDARDSAPSGPITAALDLPGPVIDAREDRALIREVNGVALWQVDPLPPRRLRPAPEGRALAVIQGQTWVLTSTGLLTPDARAVVLPAEPVALAPQGTIIVVALRRRLLTMTSTDTEPSREVRITSGRAEGLLEGPRGGLWLVTSNPSAIIRLSESLQPEEERTLSSAIVGAPRHPVTLADRIGFVGRCHSAAALDHCLYLVDDAGRGPLHRIGLPAGRSLGRPAMGSKGRVWVPDPSGRIHAVDPEERRPLLNHAFSLSGRPALLEARPDGALRAFSSEEDRMWTVEPSNGMD